MTTKAEAETLLIQEVPDAPVACDMTGAPDTVEERLAEYGRLFAHALVDRSRTADSVEFRFASKAGVAAWIADLARREAACCPFVSHQVSFTSDRVTWRISSQAGAAAQVALDEYYSAPEQVGAGIEGLLKRLADRGVPVTSSSPGHFATGSPSPATGLLSKLKAACGC